MRAKNLYFLPCVLLLVLSTACNKGKGGEDDPFAGLEKVTYTESDAVFPNPERGFYATRETHNATANPLTAAAIDVARAAGRSLYLFEYYLTDYVACDIADEYLALIRKNFQVIRENGAKALIRFAYSNGYSEKDRPWDATEEQVLRHVAQLKPIFQEYSDVIYVMQAGFVGSWGEWYYTENFYMNPYRTEHYLPRKHLLDALLDALPDDRQVEVRTPAFKMKIYGYALADTLTAAEAHAPTVKARIAGHNDCFLASESDTGTFNGKTDREYWMAETRYTIMGGESCGLSKYCDCEDGENYDGAITTMEKYHFSYLHISYHPQVLGRWKQQNCFDEVDKRLGYRLVLREGGFSATAKADSDYHVVLNMENVGFAAPMNPRDAFLVISSSDGKTVKSYPVNSDPRTWHSGTFTLDQTIKLPATPGKYVLNLYLPDPKATLKDNPRFAIRLANENVWDEKTGFNVLKEITVE
ncbi:MAG: DUF4832 domain-containing protein [Bacteroidales bacterium]|nr:DUF4832 domain-containing protein [Bacteroidales bacterium]